MVVGEAAGQSPNWGLILPILAGIASKTPDSSRAHPSGGNGPLREPEGQFGLHQLQIRQEGLDDLGQANQAASLQRRTKDSNSLPWRSRAWNRGDLGQMGIAGSGLRVGVTEEGLQFAQTHPQFQHVGREAVAQAVNADAPADAGSGHRRAHRRLHPAAVA